MKRIFFGLILVFATTVICAQKYAFVDTEYILNNIPAYKAAQDKLNKLSTDWQKEIEAEHLILEKMHQDYQAEKILLTKEMMKQREAEIASKDRAVKNLQKLFFGPNGELFKKRLELIKPIQDEVYDVIKDIAESGKYSIIFDTASGTTILFTDPKYDKSDEVLEKLGYKN
ncbi:MAG: OmpH family outer membrane protein [Bacteroidales bacterium]|nr:OmpH family outer membrane protein [Bacteroidales bacterium]